MLRLSAACTAVLTLLLVFASAPAARADWPSRPVTLMTMTAPGSQIDLLTRDVAARLQKDLGQPVIVRNIPGGSHGSIMAIELAACRPDGYVLGISATAAFTYSPHFSRGSGYSLDDFQYITLLGLNQSGVICPQDRPWKTLRDAFEWAKKENKGLSYMYQGTDDRDIMQRIASQEGVRLTLVSSTGGGPAVLAAIEGGHVDLGHVGSILFGAVSEGRARCLAASTSTRLSELPDVPTLKEQGWNESVEMYLVFVTPKGLPPVVYDRLNAALEAIYNDPSFQAFVHDKLHMAPVQAYGSEHADAYMMSASRKFAEQARAAQIAIR